ncbi:MAG TPA: glycosyltransferase family 4 protein, partial [Albitalea sp.]|nr:glycosyltransferase family 4 protein [Albitalea sp.]
ARVLHTYMPRKGKRVLPRLLAWAGFHAISSFAGLFAVPRPDVVLAVSPPLTIGLGAWVLARCHGVPFIYNVQELYPDLAVTMGVLKNRQLISALLKVESLVYRRAAAVSVIGAAMAARLREKGVPDRKIRIIPNFVDVDAITPGERCNEFSANHGFDGKLVVSYAGNLGLAQGLEVVIEAARLLRDEPRVRFLVVGDGVMRDSLAAAVQESSLDNCIFLPYQPQSKVLDVYAASDLCLVPQAALVAGQAVPSKAYQIMAAGRPVVAITEPTSDLAALVTAAGCGELVAPGSAGCLASLITDALANRAAWQRMGAAGREHVVTQYSRRSASGAYQNLLREVAAGGSAAD